MGSSDKSLTLQENVGFEIPSKWQICKSQSQKRKGKEGKLN